MRPVGTALRRFFAALSLDNYVLIGSDPLYLLSYREERGDRRVLHALLLVIGYPIAYGIARMPRRVQAVLLLCVVLPFWTVVSDPHLCLDEHFAA